MTDFQAIVDSLSPMACVVSVEHPGDGRDNIFRIVTGNKKYIDSIEHPAPGTEMLTDKFIPNIEYTHYLTRDMNFENYSYRSAVEKKCLHSYARPDRLPVWLNMTFLPLACDEGDLSYCIYLMEFNYVAESENMSKISGEMASAVLETSIKLHGSSDFRKAMDEVAEDIRKLCDAEHCCIMLIDEAEQNCSVFCDAVAPDIGMLPTEHYINHDFYKIAASWERTIDGSNCLIVKDGRDIEIVKERNPVWYESLRAVGTENIALFPLKSRDRLLAYLWVINFNADEAIKIKEALELATFIISSELGNYLLLDRLKYLSSRDMLTGVMNRNEMNNYVDRIAGESPGGSDSTSIGVIFADLNGLKEVNDRCGHSEGDRLLKNAASVLRELFDEETIFRAGGDEFTILVSGATEEELFNKMDEIRRIAQKYEKLSFALGGSVSQGAKNLRKALHIADERMYADKQKYYETHARYR